MNRRGFLQLLGSAAAVIAVPELLVPKRTSFFLPPAGGWNGWTPTTRDFSYGLDDFEERILQPAIERVSEQFDTMMLQMGDIITFEGVYDALKPKPKLKLFKVTQVTHDERDAFSFSPI